MSAPNHGERADVRKRRIDAQQDRALVEATVATLDLHDLSIGGRNLGQYRTEWECSCGTKLVTDGHNGPSLRRAWNRHLATILAEQEAQRTAAAVDRERQWHGHAARGGGHL